MDRARLRRQADRARREPVECAVLPGRRELLWRDCPQCSPVLSPNHIRQKWEVGTGEMFLQQTRSTRAISERRTGSNSSGSAEIREAEVKARLELPDHIGIAASVARLWARRAGSRLVLRNMGLTLGNALICNAAAIFRG